MTALFFDGFATTWLGDSREESEPIGLSTNEIGKIVRLSATSLGRKTGWRGGGCRYAASLLPRCLPIRSD
jgi:hypothetical protein